jgi:hypothetical protein
VPDVAVYISKAMEHLVQVVARRSYNRYWDRPDIIEPIFQVFLTQPDRTYSMQSMHEKTGVPLTTLYSWREQVRAHDDWRPSHSLSEMRNRALPDEAETIIAQFIFEQSNCCDRETAAALFIASWEELSDSVVSAAWDFDEPSAELDSDDSSDDDKFDLMLDSNRDGLDAESSDCAVEEDL